MTKTCVTVVSKAYKGESLGTRSKALSVNNLAHSLCLTNKYQYSSAVHSKIVPIYSAYLFLLKKHDFRFTFCNSSIYLCYYLPRLRVKCHVNSNKQRLQRLV